MKTLILISGFFFLMYLPSFSQIFDDSIVTESKIWSNLNGGYGSVMVECCYSTTYLKIETDPLINSSDEMQIQASTDSMQTWTKLGDIKESDNKIYFRDLENNQGLLYDFNALPGDTVKIENYTQGTDIDTIVVLVDRIDTIEYLGIQRQRFEVQDTLSGQIDYWITGIGSVKGLLNPCLVLTGGFRELLCVHDDNTLIYQNEEWGTCYVDDNTTGINKVSNNNLKVYPNPSTGYIIIDYSGEITDLSYSIYSLSGQVIESNNICNKKIETNLQAGIYLLIIKDQDALIYEDKLLVTN